MSRPRLTVGVPVYKGAALIPATLTCLQQQTFGDFEVIISVDGNDQETAEACKPFLSDRRFRMVVQKERLDWFGNFNFLLRQDLGEFFCYRQHDDTTKPEFFEVLLREAERAPELSAVYCDCQWVGGRSDIEIAPSFDGPPLARFLDYLEMLPPLPCRGIFRREALRQAGPIRHDEFRSFSEIFVWLAKVLRWGPFRRVPKPLYLRLDHKDNLNKDWSTWPEEKRRGVWARMFTGMLEAGMPLCTTPAERLFLQHMILDRIGAYRPDRWYFYSAHNEAAAAGAFMADCLVRLEQEGNAHLLQVGDGRARVDADVAIEVLMHEVAILRREHGALAAEVARLNLSRMLNLGRRIRRLLGRPAN